MIKEADPERLLAGLAEKLKHMKELTPPEWARFAKTGVNRRQPPQQDDWWWLRAASILRRLGIEGNMGVSRLRRIYGGRINRGHKPERKVSSSGAVIRTILQQLGEAKLVRSEKKKGRMLTNEGKSLLSAAVNDAKGKRNE